MSLSLQDQLLKAGVANKKQAKKASSALRKKQKNKHLGKGDGQAEKEAKQRIKEKTQRDKELNRINQEKAQRKAIAAQIRQLVEMNRQSLEDGDAVYNFLDGKTVRKIHVPEEMIAMLGRGSLSIVKLGDGYEVVSEKVANKISERDASVIIVRNQASEQRSNDSSEDDDPYADFQVPDDLMW
jgi:uncharacterized protein